MTDEFSRRSIKLPGYDVSNRICCLPDCQYLACVKCYRTPTHALAISTDLDQHEAKVLASAIGARLGRLDR